MTTIPPETIKVGVNHEEIPNPMREYYNQGWNDCAVKANKIHAKAMGKVKKMLKGVLSDVKSEPPNQTVVQIATNLVDNAMHDLLNHGCADSYSDYLTIGMIEKWLSSGNGAAYLAALVEAIRTAR